MKYWSLKHRIYYLPFWTRHSTEDVEDPEVQLSIQVAGIITALAYTQYALAGSTVAAIFAHLQAVPAIISVFISPVAMLGLPLILAGITFIAVLQYHQRFSTMAIRGYLSRVLFVADLNGSALLTPQVDRFGVAIDVLFGFCFGLLFGLLLALPYFFLLLLLIGFSYFFLAVFIPSTIAFSLSFLLAWITSIAFVLTLIIRAPTEKDPTLLGSLTYPTTPRVLEIQQSDAEPIVCQHCGSFNAATATTCRLCNGDLTQNES